jgi:phosphoglycolate phosphatase-like HAD superfamily hydrolase
MPAVPVVDEEALDQARQRRCLAGRPGVGVATLHQLGRAVADHRADIRQRDRCPALLGEHGVERAMQIGRAVDQRAVEIEDQGRAFPRHRDGDISVCTNKPYRPSLEILEVLGLIDFFGAVTGGDSLPVRKPDPGHLLGTLALLDASADAAVMVGDSANDVAVARAAGVPAIVVSYGYTRVPAAELGGDALIDSFADILAWLDAHGRSAAG